MATNYEQLYRESRHALGAATKELVSFFNDYDKQAAWVLDLGCGQGRDALLIARLGHRVTAIDHAPAGVRDLREEAEREGLAIDAAVADIRSYMPKRSYDVIVIDRTLHMLNAEDRLDLLRSLLPFVGKKGMVLIADERANIPSFQTIFDESEIDWAPILKKRGYLFLQRQP